MASKIQNVNLDAWFGDTNKGNGNGTRMSVGKGTSDWAWINRFAIQIPRGTLFDNVPSAASITAFDIRLKTLNANTGIGSAVKFWLQRGTTALTELTVTTAMTAGGNINAFVVNAGPATGRYPGPTTTSTDRGGYEGSPAADVFIKVPMLAMGQWWYAHPEVNALILVASAKDETATAQRCTFYTRESSSAPYAELTYGGNSAPAKPTDVTVATQASGFTISARGADPDGDTLRWMEILYSPNVD